MKQIGDATNLVLILAGELLKKSEQLLVMGLHPSEVVMGYEMAALKGREELESMSLRLVNIASDVQTSSPLPSPLHHSHPLSLSLPLSPHRLRPSNPALSKFSPSSSPRPLWPSCPRTPRSSTLTACALSRYLEAVLSLAEWYAVWSLAESQMVSATVDRR